ELINPGGVGVATVGNSPIACGCTAASNATLNSSAVWYRSAGDFASARAITSEHQRGRSGATSAMGVGTSLTCFCTIAIAVSALNGSRPVTRRYTTTPTAY